MYSGADCSQCHSFAISGTVFPTADMKMGCDGRSGVSVEITDANGTTVTLTSNSVGNFYYYQPSSSPPLAMPYTAVVKTAKGTLAMHAQPTRGNCNGCHTDATGSGPGRITAP